MLFLTFPVLVWLVDGSAAGRWSGAWRAAGRRLVLRLRLFPRRPLLGRLRLPGRCQDLRLAAAVRGRRAAGLSRAFHRAWALRAARLIWVRGPARVLALAATLTGAEWLRGHLFSGFPWNTFGYALTEPLALAQSVSLVGIWGLTFLCRRGLRQPGRARRRPGRHAAAAGARRSSALSILAGVRGLRRRAAVAAPDRLRRAA